MPMASADFLDMPREIRDMVYIHYTSIDGGYVYNPKTNKLKAATPCKYPFALNGSCKLIAQEMNGVALTYNTITFSTFEERDRAAMWTFLSHLFDDYETWHLGNLIKRNAIPDSTMDHVACQFPSFLSALKLMREYPEEIYIGTSWSTYRRSMGLKPSLFRKSIHGTLQCHTAEADTEILLLALHKENWCYPSDDKLSRVVKILRPGLAFREEDEFGPFKEFDTSGLHPGDRSKYYFSAATAAIRFLQSNPTTRLHIRQLVLNEDRRAILQAPSHAKGLIPFCTENPQLRIERRVNMYTNVIASHLHHVDRKLIEDDTYQHRRDGESISMILATWIQEALDLPPSISLVLDGSPAPEICSHIFQEEVLQDVICHSALEQSINRKILSFKHELEWQVGYFGYICEDFPRLIRDIIHGTSPVTCNFHIGEVRNTDIEELIEKRRGWSKQDWDNAWRDVVEGFWQLSPSPLDWVTLKEQDYIRPKDEGDVE